MLIINSAAYVDSEFRNEVGNIPPCFLPIANHKLIELQVQQIRQNHPKERIVLSLPDQYLLTIGEERLVQKLKIEVVCVPEGLSLGMAVLYVLNILEYQDEESVGLLHGDTYVDEFPLHLDCIAVSESNEAYGWEYASNSMGGGNLVWCGYFSFSNIKRLIRSLAQSQGDFVAAVHNYINQYNVKYITINHWLDLGHINTYFKARTSITTERAFNTLTIKAGVVHKFSAQESKVRAEANWYQKIPVNMKVYIPQLLNAEQDGSYEIEYLPYMPLNELFVHAKKDRYFWRSVVNLLVIFLEKARENFNSDKYDYPKILSEQKELFASKTRSRMAKYAKDVGLDIEAPLIYDGNKLPSVKQIIDDCVSVIDTLEATPCVLHGDLCFSNVLYDSRSHRIKVIDPRGINYNGEETIYGGQLYDLAKLFHSVIGLYDFIVAGSYELSYGIERGYKIEFALDDRLKDVQYDFLHTNLAPNVQVKDLYASTILLFLSMLPLHYDHPERQKALFVNALRLYIEFKRA